MTRSEPGPSSAPGAPLGTSRSRQAGPSGELAVDHHRSRSRSRSSSSLLVIAPRVRRSRSAPSRSRSPGGAGGALAHQHMAPHPVRRATATTKATVQAHRRLHCVVGPHARERREEGRKGARDARDLRAPALLAFLVPLRSRGVLEREGRGTMARVGGDRAVIPYSYSYSYSPFLSLSSSPALFPLPMPFHHERHGEEGRGRGIGERA